MYRDILNQLAEWKEKKGTVRKTLLLSGAKGVGKSYTLEDFGAGYFANTCTFDFDRQDYVRYLFEDELDEKLILKKLSVSCGESLMEGDTLLVFENVDVMKNSSEIVKFICDNFRKYHVVFTLRYMESTFLQANPDIKEKVDVINIYPLSFSEFLIVNKENEFCNMISNQSKQPLREEDMRKLENYLRVYFFTGGMPSVVKTYVETMSMSRVEEAKKEILHAMDEEINAIPQAPLRAKVKQVVASIPNQLEKDNKKFRYGMVKLTARAREYKDAVQWLIDNKYVAALYRAKEPIASLAEQKDEKAFEMFANDIGILVSMFGMSYSDIEASPSAFELKGGALLEQYVYSELLHNPNVGNIYYWISEATARIPFLFQDGSSVIPIELNLDSNEKAQSLKVFKSRYKVPMAIRITRNRMHMSGGTLTLPLFSIWNL